MASHFLLGFVDILREALKIFHKNGKLMASFTLLTLSVYSLLFLFNIFSMKPLLSKWITDESLLLFTGPNTPKYANLLVAAQKDIRILVGTEWIFLVISSFISFFFSSATILASATTHSGKNFSLKDLFSTAASSFKRPFLTLLYLTLFGVGYFFLALVLLPLPLTMSFQSHFALKVYFILLSVSAEALYDYLAVVWTLALAVSVLEESYGIEALGKAAKIVKGMEMHGFLVNLVMTILSFIVRQGFEFLKFKDFAVGVIIGLLILNSVWLLKMFGLMAYTVLYYQCKKTHGEEVEFQGDLEYSKIPNFQFITENIP